jgi:hypothetical protein
MWGQWCDIIRFLTAEQARDPRLGGYLAWPFSFAIRLIYMLFLTFFLVGLTIQPLTYLFESSPVLVTFCVSVISAPLAEEWLKAGHAPFHAAFALSELWLYGLHAHRVPAFAMHFFGAGQPNSYRARVVFHAGFNSLCLLHFVLFPQQYPNSDAATQHSNMTDFRPFLEIEPKASG